MHRRAGEQDADQRAGRGAQALGPADSHGSRREAGEPAQKGKAVHDGSGGGGSVIACGSLTVMRDKGFLCPGAPDWDADYITL